MVESRPSQCRCKLRILTWDLELSEDGMLGEALGAGRGVGDGTKRLPLLQLQELLLSNSCSSIMSIY